MASDFTPPCFAVVAEDFEGLEEEELTLNAGTKVIVVAVDDDGWYTLLTKNKSGIFPGSYLDPLQHIQLPCFGKIAKSDADNNLVEGEILEVTDINEDGWLVNKNNVMVYCSWSNISISKQGPRPPVSPRKPAARKPPGMPGGGQNQNLTIGNPPVRPQSVVKEPQPINANLQRGPGTKPKNPNPHPNLQKAPGGKPTNSNLQSSANKKTTFSPTERPVAKTAPKAESATVTAKPGEMHTSKFSTYRRPVSIFDAKLQHEDIMQSTPTGKNLYEIPMDGAPRYELEGRFEFRATSDIPSTPPTFKGIEKKYATGQPSFVDWSAKERSAVFDI